MSLETQEIEAMPTKDEIIGALSTNLRHQFQNGSPWHEIEFLVAAALDKYAEGLRAEHLRELGEQAKRKGWDSVRWKIDAATQGGET